MCCSIKPVASPTHEPCHLLSKRSIQDDVGTAVPMITHVCLTSYARYASSAPCSVTTGLNCKGSQKPTSEFLIIKPTRCTNFSNLFWKDILHVSDSSSVHHQELFTACKQDQDGTTFYLDPACKLWANLYDIQLLCVQWKTPDDGQGNCPEHVEFLSKINLRNWCI